VKPGSIGDELAVYAKRTGGGAANHFPGATWEFKTPADLRLAGVKLEQFARNVGGVGAIVKDGYMVKT